VKKVQTFYNRRSIKTNAHSNSRYFTIYEVNNDDSRTTLKQLVEGSIDALEKRHEEYIQEINKVKDFGMLISRAVEQQFMARVESGT
jgi:hypothetical protein